MSHIYYYPVLGTGLKALYVLIHFILMTTLGGGLCYYSILEEKRRDQLSHLCKVTQLGQCEARILTSGRLAAEPL